MKKLYTLLLLGAAAFSTQAQTLDGMAGTWKFTLKPVTLATSTTVSIEDEEIYMFFNAEVSGTSDVVFTAIEDPEIIIKTSFSSSDNKLTILKNIWDESGSNIGIGPWAYYSQVSGSYSGGTVVTATTLNSDYTFGSMFIGTYPAATSASMPMPDGGIWGIIKTTFTSSSQMASGTFSYNAESPETSVASWVYQVVNAEKSATLEVEEVTFEETTGDEGLQAEITVTGVSGIAVDGTQFTDDDITVYYLLNEENPVEMEMTESGTYNATIDYNLLDAGTYVVSVKVVATQDGEEAATYEKADVGVINVRSIEIGNVEVAETPAGEPTRAEITVTGVAGVGIEEAEITVTCQINNEDPVEMTDVTAESYSVTFDYSELEPGTTYQVTVVAKASVEGVVVATAVNDEASFTVPQASGISEITSDSESVARYYNLQGIEVKNPSNGIFIKVVDGKATKVMLK